MGIVPGGHGVERNLARDGEFVNLKNLKIKVGMWFKMYSKLGYTRKN